MSDPTTIDFANGHVSVVQRTAKTWVVKVWIKPHGRLVDTRRRRSQAAAISTAKALAAFWSERIERATAQSQGAAHE